jgi:hypothetical protein
MSRIVSAERQAVARRSPGIISLYSSLPLLKGHTFCNEKSGLITGVASLEGYKLVIVYYLSASDLFPHKRGVRLPLMGGAL